VNFIDTGAFLARDIQRDQYHQQEAKHWCELLYERIGCFASNLVLDEAITLLARRATHEFAAPRRESVGLQVVVDLASG
jgi:predicted nucleic acid-binding protein